MGYNKKHSVCTVECEVLHCTQVRAYSINLSIHVWSRFYCNSTLTHSVLESLQQDLHEFKQVIIIIIFFFQFITLITQLIHGINLIMQTDKISE